MTRRRLGALVGSVVITAALGGCGATVGTLIESSDDVLMHPFREWLFMGAFEFDNPWDERWAPLRSRRDCGQALVGITFSGGGSRSAYFSACVLEELGKRKIPGTDRTFLEELDVVAGVSGGSLAATYYCANRRREGFPRSDQAFFERMRHDMALDFEARSIARVALAYWPLLQFTHYNMGDVLASVMDANFLDDLTYGDLDPDGPILCTTAVCYNNAQKFVFTNGRLASFGAPRPTPEFGWSAAYRYGKALTFRTIDSSIAKCPLSTGVHASSAVPGLIGRAVLENKQTGEAVYLGDGGLYDNSGTETLLQALAPLGVDHPKLPIYILVVDAAGVFVNDEDAGNVTTLAGFLNRTTEIAWLRAGALSAQVFRRGVREAYRAGVLKQLPFAEVITLYDDAGTSKGSVVRKLGTKVLEFVRGIPTRYSISSEATEAIHEVAPGAVEAAMKRLERTHAERPKVLERLKAAQPEPPRLKIR